MSVEKVTAWRITTGQCFENKAEACHEEMVYLVRTRKDQNGLNSATFDQAVDDQEQFVTELQKLRSSLDKKLDKKIIEEVDILLARASGWLEDAVALNALIADEKA